MKKIENLCNLVAKFVSDKRAQSVVLGFVIIMGIVLSASIILISLQIPEQTKKFEAEHASKVPHDFAALSSAIDAVALSGDETASATCDFGMASETVPFLGIHASGGTLSFETSSERFECLAYVPGENHTLENGTHWWNSTPNDFLDYDKFHVDTFLVVGAKLKLETGENRIYNSSGDEYLSGEFWFNNFTVTNNTTLYTSWLTVHAKNITIGPNSSINADGAGIAGGKCAGWPLLSESGKGEGGGNIPDSPCRHPKLSSDWKYCYCGAGGGGAGHYSAGGDGGYSWTGSDCYGNMPNQNRSGGLGGSSYGNATNMSTTDSGSGGATAAFGQVTDLGTTGAIFEGGFGGDGGSIIHLDAPTINIMGNVSANGEDGHYSKDLDRAWDSAGGGGGGGSGGTILLKGDNIIIPGNISAKGGDGADGALACDHNTNVYDSNGGGGGGGSGGVIKIFYGINISAPGGLANHTNVNGGAGGHGGVGKSPGCSIGNVPKPGGDGSPGGDGLDHNESYPEYIESVPHYSTGWLISRVNDTGSEMVRYGNITWSEKNKSSGTSIYMKVRTCTNADMTGAMPWENCPEVTNETDISDYPAVSDGHRYIQWRADLYTLERSRTPVLQSVNIGYEYGLPVIENCSGSIVFGSHYLYLPNYKLVYAHGATIKSQSTGEFVFHSPPITIRRDGSTTSLAISSVNLTGSEESVSGAFCSAVKASYEDADLLTGGLNFHNLTLNITTEFPTAWRNWFHETCEKEGLVNGTAAGDYFIIGSGTSDHPVSIVFYGNESRPVNLWLKESKVAIKVEG